MRQKTKLFLSLAFFFGLFSLPCHAQNSYNMYLLSNLNQHVPDFYAIGCWGYVQNGREYAIIGCYDGTAFIDITDSSNIHEVAYLPGSASTWRDFRIHSHYVYIVADVAGTYLQIADIQYLPDSVHYVTTFSFSGFSRAHTIEQSGPYLYVNGGNYSGQGVFVLDISNPENPVRRGQWENAYVHDERVLNDTLWACNIYVATISIIDATNKDSLRFVTNWNLGSGSMPHNCAITNDRRFILTTDEILNPVGHLRVWNIEDIHNVQYVTTWIPAGGDSSNVHNVEIYGNYALISHYTAGVRLLDISNPAMPVEVAWYDTYPQNNGTYWLGCKGIYLMPSGKIIANDRQTGFYCLKTTFPIGITNNQTSPKNYSLRQNYPNPFNPATTIEFSLPKNEHITLKVYDILGREVVKLFDGISRAGENRITFTPSNLPSGIYFYRLAAEDFSDTKKMILIK